MIGLQRHKVPCHIYESAHAFGEIGAGVAFGPNSQRAMSLIDPIIKEGYDKRATANAWPEMQRVWFQFRHGMDGQDASGVKAGDFITQVKSTGETEHETGSYGGHSGVHRAHFLDEMVKRVPEGGASFGKRCVGLEDMGPGKGVRMVFADGTEAFASAVVGCDGIKSTVRQYLLGKEAPESHAVFTGKYAYRGIINMDKAAGLLGDKLARNRQMYMGYHGHVLTFPIEKGRTMNVVAFRAKANGKWEDDRWVVPMTKEEMMKDFEGWGEHVRKILSMVEKPDVWALFDHPPAKTYFRGRVCLLGDAAHASTPHQGAGAGMAMEDGFVLSRLLREINEEAELEKAFRAYDAVRRPRSQKLVATSRTAGTLYEFEMEGIKDDVQAIQKELHTRYKWLWDADLEEHLREAEAVLREQASAA